MKANSIYSLGLVFLLSLSLNSDLSANSTQQKHLGESLTAEQTAKSSIYMGFRIDKDFTATNGCVFKVRGDYSVFTGFVGTITVACPGHSATVYTFTFIVPAGGGNIIYQSGDQAAWDAYIEDDVDLKADIADYLTSL